MRNTFSEAGFRKLCNKLALKDPDLAGVISTHGYPPMWARPNSFETLVHIILEQQVSLASALAALRKLQAHTKGLSPRKVLALSDDTMKACYVSRQKAGYIKGLAHAIVKKELVLDELALLPDEAVRARLTALKGIGNWTADVYLMFVLQRSDIFPIGDLAAVNAMKRIKGIPVSEDVKAKILELATAWKPHRTIATMILWHYYLSSPRKGRIQLVPDQCLTL